MNNQEKTLTNPKGSGRPSLYSDELTDVICELMADGKSEKQIGEMEGMPTRQTMRMWRRTYPDFLAKCARAREEQGHLAVDEMVEIEQEVIDGNLPCDVARVVLSSKQWRASKLAKAHYGDKLSIEIPKAIGINSISATLTDEQAAEVYTRAMRD
jgi:hypothetical protein